LDHGVLVGVNDFEAYKIAQKHGEKVIERKLSNYMNGKRKILPPEQANLLLSYVIFSFKGYPC
jgi:hypothetical protein